MHARNLFILFLIWAVCIQAQNSTSTFTVLTFNVYGAPDSDWPTRLGMILDELESLKPDVICLQEIVETPGTQGADNRAKILADSLFERTGVGYNYTWQRTHFSWSTFDEGIAIMSPHIILESDFVDLPRGLFNRKSLWVKVLTPSGIVNFFNTHLSFGNQEDVRIEQVKAIKVFVSEKSAQNIATANILCGDFNAIPGSPPIQLLTQQDTSWTIYLDSWDFINPSDPGLTIPSDNPNARIDYIMLKNDSETEILASEQVFKTPNTDNIFPSDHIGVISTLNTNIYALDLELQYPGTNDELAGEIEISWSISNKTEDVAYKIFVSNDAGKSWQSLWEGESAANSYTWNTLNGPDGANYLLKIAAIGDTSYGLTQSTGTFIVNNPGNSAPELKLKAPKGGEFIENDLQIKWEAKDADSDELFISIEYSVNTGASWLTIVENMANTGSYLWDTNLVPNSSRYMVKVNCTDDSVTVSDSSKTFSIVNQRVEMPNSNFNHIEGNGSGTAAGNVFDLDLLTGHEYRITFNDSLTGIKTYNVFDKQSAQFVLENATEMDGVTEGPPFDGIRLVIFDYKEAKKDGANTRWDIGNTNLEHTISLPVILIGDETIYGFPYPADYKITMADQVVDTSSTYLNVEAIPMKFSVQNITENHRVDIIYFENNSDHTIGPLDKIYILEKDESGEPMITWLIFFANELSPILPEPGDEFVLATLKPFTNKDVFEFKATISGMEKAGEDTPNTFSLSQNYPNPFNSLTTITFRLQASAKVELSVYNVTGQRIRELIKKPLAAGSHSIKWDAANLASGLYFYKIKAGKYSAVKKALLIK